MFGTRLHVGGKHVLQSQPFRRSDRGPSHASQAVLCDERSSVGHVLSPEMGHHSERPIVHRQRGQLGGATAAGSLVLPSGWSSLSCNPRWPHCNAFPASMCDKVSLVRGHAWETWAFRSAPLEFALRRTFRPEGDTMLPEGVGTTRRKRWSTWIRPVHAKKRDEWKALETTLDEASVANGGRTRRPRWWVYGRPHIVKRRENCKEGMYVQGVRQGVPFLGHAAEDARGEDQEH